MAVKERALGFLLGALMAGGLTAAPVYTATYISLNDDQSVVSGGSWTYVGADFSLSGSDEFTVANLPYDIDLNTQYVITIPVVPRPGEGPGGADTQAPQYVGGVDVSKDGVFGSLAVTAGPFSFAPGQDSEALPATLVGTIYGCDNAAYGLACFNSDADAAYFINFDLPGFMTVEVGEGKYGATLLTNVNFTSVPELPTVWLLAGALSALALKKQLEQIIARLSHGLPQPIA